MTCATILAYLPFFSGTMMCYGQTGAGKTFTITGATESYKQRGILPRTISQLFKEIEERPEYSITVRYVFRYFLRW
jgi:kinesin family protein 6/9